jgi:restriction system protein
MRIAPIMRQRWWPSRRVQLRLPEQQIESSYRVVRVALAADLMERVKEQPPAFTEQLVLDVLRAMGYGGSHEDASQHLGQSGDEGVDGVIREDELGP